MRQAHHSGSCARRSERSRSGGRDFGLADGLARRMSSCAGLSRLRESVPMRYNVNATVWFPAWLELEADSPEAALEEAKGYSARDFERDEHAGQIEFDYNPAVTEAA